MNPSRETLVEIFDAAIAAVDPYHAVLDALNIQGNLLSAAGEIYDLSKFERILVVGAGKAAGRMAKAVEELLGTRISEGLVIVKTGQCIDLEIVEQVEASHPVPDAAGMEGTRRILGLVENAKENT
nr:DUF4147 domain-containing protein [Burkholderiales bacterium]